jgi:hypothetical protein
MPGISRRRFLRDASLGAAAVGTVAVVGPSAFSVATASSAGAASLSAGAASLDHDSGEHGAAVHRSAEREVMAHIVDESSGTISLYSGTRMVTVQNRAVTEALLKALR